MEGLYIEDDKIQQLVMSATLAHLNVKLHLASSGMDGLGMAQKILPAFIIMDMGLPDVEGSILLKLFKKDVRVKDIPVIVTTADLLIHEKVNIWETGHAATACIFKPLTISKLADILKQLFEDFAL